METEGEKNEEKKVRNPSCNELNIMFMRLESRLENMEKMFQEKDDKEMKMAKEKPVGEGKKELPVKKERTPWNWVALQGLSQMVTALVLVAFLVLVLTGCSVQVPEKTKHWTYYPSSTLREGMTFSYDEEKGEVLVLKDGEILKTMDEGDRFAFLPFRYVLTVEESEELVLVRNGEEELARFVFE